MDYIELKCNIPENTEMAREVLVAELGTLGYESFQDFEDGILAYIKSDDFDAKAYIGIYCVKEKIFGEITFSHQLFKDKNWNEYWEKNFQPVIIGKQLIIKAPFHTIKEKYEYELVLEPKMSFGTGHHATTWLMLAEMLKMNLFGKDVIDVGCGTGILSIFAHMRGAKKIIGFDNNDWAYNNALENIELNNTGKVELFLGEISSLNISGNFDIVLANINRNVILDEMKDYVGILKNNGEILFSGILIENFNDVDTKAKKQGLHFVKKVEREKWILIKYQKK